MNIANIAVTSGIEYSSALMHILWNFQKIWDDHAGKLLNHFLKTKWPHYPVKNYIYYINTVPRTIFVADKDDSTWAALSNDGNTAVSPIPQAHIIWPWKWSSKCKSFFQFQMAVM